jgi:hypothetical protein
VHRALHLRAVSLFALLTTVVCTAAAATPADTGRLWRQGLLNLQATPASPHWQGDMLTFAGAGRKPCLARVHLQPDASLPPVLYLLDRPDVEQFQPSSSHSSMVLDVAALWTGGDLSPEPTRHPAYQTVLTAQRALSLLLGQSCANCSRAGLVGEGRGGGVALLLAALATDQAAFVAAHEPRTEETMSPALEARTAERRYRSFAGDLELALECSDLVQYMPQVACPTLLTCRPPNSAHTQACYEALTCEREVRVLARGEEWWSVWRAWAAGIVG